MYDSATPADVLGKFSFLDFQQADETFLDALLTGLSRPAKSIPCRFLYDKRGSELFDEICGLPEYYPTRTETRILRERASDIASLIGPGASLIELGSGSSTKTRILLNALDALAEYVPIDVSGDHLRDAALQIASEYPAVDVTAICANYGTEWPLPDTQGRPVGFFPGSTIGNLTQAEARDLLAAWRKRLGNCAQSKHPDGLTAQPLRQKMAPMTRLLISDPLRQLAREAEHRGKRCFGKLSAVNAVDIAHRNISRQSHIALDPIRPRSD